MEEMFKIEVFNFRILFHICSKNGSRLKYSTLEYYFIPVGGTVYILYTVSVLTKTIQH